MRPGRTMIPSYQWTAGLYEFTLGVCMVAAPDSHLIHLLFRNSDASVAVYSFAGMFVFTLGLCAFLGAYLELRRDSMPRLQTIWLLTAIIHSGAAIYVAMQILTGALTLGWLLIAIPFALFAIAGALFLRWSSSPVFLDLDSSRVEITQGFM